MNSIEIFPFDLKYDIKIDSPIEDSAAANANKKIE